jgi:hypothetical protein
MDPENVTLFVAVVDGSAAVIGVVVALVLRRERHRRGRLQEIAGDCGCTFTARPDGAFVKALRNEFWMFRNYRRGAVLNLLERRADGILQRVFEYA